MTNCLHTRGARATRVAAEIESRPAAGSATRSIGMPYGAAVGCDGASRTNFVVQRCARAVDRRAAIDRDVLTMDLGIAGRTAAVAAGSAGLGFGSARALVANGVRVALCGRNEERLMAAARSLGPLAVPLVADVSTVGGAVAFVEAARAELGHIDILVANAGGPPPGTFASTPLAAYLPAIELSLLSAVAMCQAVVPEMQTRRWGRIVAITSISVRQPIANLVLSNTARAGLTGFLKTLAREVAADGVTVNSVQPGVHATERISNVYSSMADAAVGVPAGVVGDPNDFGQIVAFLCSGQSRFITGAALPVDGGSYAGLQ